MRVWQGDVIVAQATGKIGKTYVNERANVSVTQCPKGGMIEILACEKNPDLVGKRSPYMQIAGADNALVCQQTSPYAKINALGSVTAVTGRLQFTVTAKAQGKVKYGFFTVNTSWLVDNLKIVTLEPGLALMYNVPDDVVPPGEPPQPPDTPPTPPGGTFIDALKPVGKYNGKGAKLVCNVTNLRTRSKTGPLVWEDNRPSWPHHTLSNGKVCEGHITLTVWRGMTKETAREVATRSIDKIGDKRERTMGNVFRAEGPYDADNPFRIPSNRPRVGVVNGEADWISVSICNWAQDQRSAWCPLVPYTPMSKWERVVSFTKGLFDRRKSV